jgi:hypothetical protein
VIWSRRNKENPGDRVILEQSEARELYRTWETNKDRDFVRGRLERAERIYGTGARDRVRTYMGMMKNGTLE